MSIAKKIILSLSSVIGISAILAYLFYDGHTARSFIKWWSLFTTVQLIAHYTLMYLIDLLVIKKVSRDTIAAAKLNAATNTNVLCPCDRKHPQLVNISLIKDNTYTCTQCNKQVSAFIEINTALKTNPLPVNKLPDMLEDMEFKLTNE